YPGNGGYIVCIAHWYAVSPSGTPLDLRSEELLPR
ncbi:MAG: hypothetical protein QOC83_5617, partial [Pseudonocardiales bacterium]|nr:hypothetical protein [Pseudonocardiales bacterium]